MASAPPRGAPLPRDPVFLKGIRQMPSGTPPPPALRLRTPSTLPILLREDPILGGFISPVRISQKIVHEARVPPEAQ